MAAYTIILPNERAKTYHYVTLFILLINLFVFIFVYLHTAEARLRNFCFEGALISLASLILFLINKYTHKIPSFRVEITFLILSFFWFLAGNFLLAVSMLCFAFTGMYNLRKLIIVFSKEKIIYPSFPRKVFLWKDVANVILKDGMLTIDLKNNRLIQVVIEKESALDINEREFNLFCEKMITIW